MFEQNERELVAWMKLTRVQGLGPVKISTLLRHFGGINEIFGATDTSLLESRVFREGMLTEWHKLKDASDEHFIQVVRDCKRDSVSIMPLYSPDYPKKLKHIASPPLTLFLAGNNDLLNKESMAIVGTRKPSEPAREFAYSFANKLAEKYVIVSGGAEGIDTAAHRGALDAAEGQTICVLGSGFNRAYPPQNEELFRQIRGKGLLVSEHLPNFPGSAFSLLQRNRITSGLAEGLLICASNESGGTMVQTKLAFEQRKPVFCPDVSMNLQPNEGIKMAIRKFGAKQVRTPDDIVSALPKKPAKLYDFA